MLKNKQFVIALIFVVSLFIIDASCAYKEKVDMPISYDRAVMNVGYTTIDTAIKSYSLDGQCYHIIDVDGNEYRISQNNCTLIRRSGE